MVTLKYPKKSHRKSINIPRHSASLAELFGIILGDGSIPNNWQFKISMNSISDYNYSLYIKTLVRSLFNLNTSFMFRKNEQTLVLTCNSTSVVEYLLANDLMSGNKMKNHIDIPEWIKNNNCYSRLAVRGLTDTDGCLYLHRHTINNKKYCNLGYCFSSGSAPLLRSVAKILENNGIRYKIQNNIKIYLYSEKEVKRYLDIFGTSNDRIKDIYSKWMKEYKK